MAAFIPGSASLRYSSYWISLFFILFFFVAVFFSRRAALVAWTWLFCLSIRVYMYPPSSLSIQTARGHTTYKLVNGKKRGGGGIDRPVYSLSEEIGHARHAIETGMDTRPIFRSGFFFVIKEKHEKTATLAFAHAVAAV
jgi:hypothetical protein